MEFTAVIFISVTRYISATICFKKRQSSFAASLVCCTLALFCCFYGTAKAANDNQQTTKQTENSTTPLSSTETQPPLHTVVAFGDSITAGYGLPDGAAWPEELARQLKAENIQVTMINAGVSGDTSAGGKARIEWTLSDKPDLLILALGANDGLRGLPPELMYNNLAAILRACRKANVLVLLTGMLAPQNMGTEYETAFNMVFPALAKSYSVPFYPFLLDGVALKTELNQSDGIHPNEEGAKHIATALRPEIKSLLKSLATRAPAK